MGLQLRRGRSCLEALASVVALLLVSAASLFPQRAAAQQCNVTLPLANAGCNVTWDPSVLYPFVCYVNDTAATTVPDVWFVSPPTSNTTVSRCMPAREYVFTVPPGTGVVSLATLAAFDAAQPYEEAALLVEDPNGIRYSLGTFVPGGNTVDRLPGTNTFPPLPTTSPDYYPQNGVGVCKNRLSVQTWSNGPQGIGITVAKIVIEDPARKLSIYGVTLFTCAKFGDGSRNAGSHVAGGLVPIRTLRESTVALLPQPSWSACAQACRTAAACQSWIFDGTSCQMFSRRDVVDAAPGVSPASLMFGLRASQPRRYPTLMTPTPTVAEQAKFTQPAWYRSFSSLVYAVASSDPTLLLIVPIDQLTTFVVGVAQTNMATAAITAWVADVVQKCGSVGVAGTEGFVNGTAASDGCGTVLYCPRVQVATAVRAPLAIRLSDATPNASCGGGEGTIGVVHYQGTLQANAFYYYSYTSPPYGVLTVVASILSEKHGAAVRVVDTSTLDSATFSHLYLTQTDPPTASPAWHWTDRDGAERAASILCSVPPLLGYSVSHDNPGSSGDFNCGQYNSTYNIIAACDALATCYGFTTKVTTDPATNITTEAPNCLKAAGGVGIGGTDTSYTLFTKQLGVAGSATCTFPAMGATKVTIRVTNALPGATYTVAADGATIATCSAASMPSTAAMPCRSYVPCYSGVVPNNVAAVTVTVAATGPYHRTCASALFAAEAAFDVFTVRNTPSPSCVLNAVAATAADGGCPNAVANTAATCASSREVGSVAVPQSYCPTPADGLSFTVATPAALGRDVMTVVDFTSVATDGVVFSVVAAGAPAGVPYLLGYIVPPSQSTDPIAYVPLRRAPRPSASLCAAAALRGTTPLANLQVFPIPAVLTAANPGVVTVRGVGLNVDTVARIDAPCAAFVVAQQPSDRAFHAVLPGVALDGAILNDTTGASTWTDCGLRCSADPLCAAFSFSTPASCQLRRGAGRATVQLANNAIAGVSATVLQVTPVFPAEPAATFASFFASTTGDLAVVFIRASDTRTALHLRAATMYRVAMSPGGLATARTMVATVAAGVTGQTCGNDFEPFVAGKPVGGTASCASLAVCPIVYSPTPFGGPLSFGFSLGIGVGGCSSSFPALGLVATDGKMSDGSVHSQAILSRTTALYDLAHSVAQGFVASHALVATIGGDPQNMVVFHDPLAATASTSPGLVRTTGAYFCELVNRLQFLGTRGATGMAAAQFSCGLFASYAQATVSCTDDPKCLGFDVDTATGNVGCLFSSTATQTGIGRIFFQKTVTDECTFDMVPGGITVSLAQINLQQGAGIARIYYNGVLLKRCGANKPFINGVSTAKGPECTRFMRCLDDAVYAPGTLRVVFPPGTTEACPYHAAVLVQFTAAQAASRLPYLAAATLTQRRTIRIANTAAVAMSASVVGTGITQVAVLVEQDRYGCVGPCNAFFSINVSLGPQYAGRCGATAGFAEGPGLSSGCGIYYYCGTLQGATLPQTFSAAGTVSVAVVDPAVAGATTCDQVFRAVLLTNGRLLAQEAGDNDVRMMYVVKSPTALGASTDISDATLPSLLATSHPEHAASAAWVGNASLYPRTFQVQENFEVAPSWSYAVFTVANEDYSNAFLGPGEAAACLMDNPTDFSADLGCFVRIDANWVTIKVAQTKFDGTADTLTVRVGNITRLCGGDNLFYGFHGNVDQCGTYFLCYDGPVVPGTTIEMSFSPTLAATRCSPIASVVVEAQNKAAVQQVTCTDAAPMACVPTGTCLALGLICDKSTNCIDGSDESQCLNWNFVGYMLVPKCDPLKIIAAVSMTPETCLRWAIAKGATSYVTNSTSCRVYSCLEFSNPQLSVGNISSVTSTEVDSLYIYASDGSVFHYCTDALHCSNNGHVQSTAAPCQCTCDPQYVGTTCESLRDISLIDQIVVVFPPSTAVNATVLDAITAAFSLQVPTSIMVSVDSVASSETSVGVRLKFTAVSGAISADQLYELLTPAESSAIMERLSSWGALRISASSVVGNTATAKCRKADFTVEGYSCEAIVAINATKSVAVSLPGISFSQPSQSVRVTLISATNSTVAINCGLGDWVQSLDPLASPGPCAYVSSCNKPGNRFQSQAVKIDFSTSINPSGGTCNGFLVDATVDIDGFVDFPDVLGSSPSTSEQVFENKFLYVAIALFVIGGLSVVLFVVWLRIRHKFELFKHAGPLLGASAFFLIFFGICLAAYWRDTASRTYTHILILEEYRDGLCGASDVSFIPHRVSYVPIDTTCHQVNVIGNTEGIVFLAAMLDEASGNISLRRGGTVESCSSAPLTTAPLRKCLSEAVLFPWKVPLEVHPVSLVALPTDVALRRIAAVNNFNPPTVLSSATSVDSLLPGEAYNQDAAKTTYLVQGQIITRWKPTQPIDHFLVINGSDMPPDVAAAPWSPRRVRWNATMLTEATLFEHRSQVAYSSPPLLSHGDKSDFTDVGTFFNGYRTEATPLVGERASRDALFFENIIGSSIDLGTYGDFTVSFWLNVDATSRGIVFAVVDNWVTTTYTSPPLLRLLSVIENGVDTTPWFGERWSIYSAIYINGNSRSLYFVQATPENGVVQYRWDLAFLQVDRVFDGGWHFIALRFTNMVDRREALLFVDGETSYSNEGWTLCVQASIPPVKRLPNTSLVNIFNKREERVKQGGLFVVGHLNGGVYDISVHGSSLPQEKLVAYGASGMELYAQIAIKESLVLGILMLLFALMIILWSAFQAWQYLFGISEDVSDVQETSKTTTAQVAAGGAGVSTRTVQFWQFIAPVASVSQSMAMYFGGWQWPKEFTNFFGSVFSILSFDWFLVLPQIPVILFPIIQFFVATFTLWAILYLAIKDQDVYHRCIKNYRDSKKEKMRVFRVNEDDRPKPTYVWYLDTSNTDRVRLRPDQEEVLLRQLQDLLTTRHKRDANMRLHTQKLVEIPSLGRGIVLYERINGKVFISFRAQASTVPDANFTDIMIHSPTTDPSSVHLHLPGHNQAGATKIEASMRSPEEMAQVVARMTEDLNKDVKLVQYSFEAICDNTHCPLHRRRLLQTENCNLPCVHTDNPLYRSYVCARSAIYYTCPEEDCEYAVCEQCYYHGVQTAAVSSALSAGLAKIREVRRMGIAAWMGTFVVIVAGIVYLPVVKNAMMIIFCHPTFQCEFGSCWRAPDLKYTVALVMSFLAVATVGIGLIVTEVLFLTHRHRVMVPVIPMKELHRTYNFWFLPQNVPLQENYFEYLKFDTSMLKSLYETFEFQYFWFNPAQLFFKVLSIIALVVAVPSSLTQLGCVCAIEVLYTALLVILVPYNNIWVEALCRIGCFHNLVQLGLMCLHRVDIQQNPDSIGYAIQMQYVSVVYFIFVVLILIAVIVVPSIVRIIEQRKRISKDTVEDLEV